MLWDFVEEGRSSKVHRAKAARMVSWEGKRNHKPLKKADETSDIKTE